MPLNSQCDTSKGGMSAQSLMLTAIKQRSAPLSRLINRLPNVPRTLLLHTVKGSLLGAAATVVMVIITPDPVTKAVFLQLLLPNGVMLGFLSGVAACLKLYPQTLFSRLVRWLLAAFLFLLAILSFGMLGGLVGVAVGKRF